MESKYTQNNQLLYLLHERFSSGSLHWTSSLCKGINGRYSIKKGEKMCSWRIWTALNFCNHLGLPQTVFKNKTKDRLVLGCCSWLDRGDHQHLPDILFLHESSRCLEVLHLPFPGLFLLLRKEVFHSFVFFMTYFFY